MRMKVQTFLKFVLPLFFLVCAINSAKAIVVAVTNNNPNGAGSFDAAIEAVNLAGGAGHTINVNTAGPILLASQVINAGVTINGNGVILDGTGAETTAGFGWFGNALFAIWADNVTVNDVVFQNSVAFGILIYGGPNGGPGRTNITLTDCRITSSANVGITQDIWADGAANTPNLSTGLTLTRCEIDNNGTDIPAQAFAAGSGMQLAWYTNVLIDDCNFHDNADHGLFWEGGYKVCAGCNRGVNASIIRNSTFSDNGTANLTGGGITIEDQSDDNLIDNNICGGNSEHGIWLRQDCDRNTISNNTTNANGFNGGTFSVGINLALGGCDDNIVENNTSNGNENHGIYVYLSLIHI